MHRILVENFEEGNRIRTEKKYAYVGELMWFYAWTTTMVSIFVHKTLIENFEEQNYLYLFFIYLEKAYDRILIELNLWH